MKHIKRFIHSILILGMAVSLLAACSSSDPDVVNAEFSAQGIKGKFEGDIVVIDLSELGNCATTIESMTIAAETYGATVSPDPRVARDYTNPVEFTITAPDGTQAVFKVKVKGADCFTAPAPKPVVPNTPLQIGKISCNNAYKLYPVWYELDATVCSVEVIDPDGIQSVIVRTSNDSLPEYNPAFSAITNNGSTYSVTLSYFEGILAGFFPLEFIAVGKKPDGSAEAPNSSATDIEVCSDKQALAFFPFGISSCVTLN